MRAHTSQLAIHEGLPGTGYSQEWLVYHVHRQGGQQNRCRAGHWEPGRACLSGKGDWGGQCEPWLQLQLLVPSKLLLVSIGLLETRVFAL